jgi:hypothetical protein
MDKQDIIKLYGKNIYQIRLELAMQLYLKEKLNNWELADIFVGYMLSDEHKPLLERL